MKKIMLLALLAFVSIVFSGCTAAFWQSYSELYQQNLAQNQHSQKKAYTVQSSGSVDYFYDSNTGANVGTGQKIGKFYYYEGK